MSRKIIVITGATATGKTALSIELAKKINAEIICADSRIVYKNLDIVSAKPTLEERQGIIHHLIDIIEADKEFSAGDFERLAQNIIKNTKDNIIISGGTWFYIKSLTDSLELPEITKDEKLRQQLSDLDNDTLWKKLSELDYKRAQLIHPNNRDKVIRSIEMCLLLGVPISEYKRKEKKNLDAIWFTPDISREATYERINKRVDIMLKEGLYSEWEKNKKLYPNSKVLKNTIGYKEFFDLDNGVYKSFDEAVDKIKQHTRNFAKRQLIYFRSRNDIQKVKNVDEILKFS